MFMSERITDTENLVAYITQYQRKIDEKILLRKAYHSIMEATAQFKIDSKLLIDAIFIALEGKFHPKILQEKLFWETKTKSESRSKFPFPNKELSIREVLAISKILIIFLDEKLIYVMDIPLVEPLAFNIFKLYIVPTLQMPGQEDLKKDPENLYSYTRQIKNGSIIN